MKPIRTVFCVEDNEDRATLIAHHLDALGYRMCGIADNARDAVAGIGRSNPDLVLIDITLNGRPEGLEIGRFLVLETDIPFIYVSGQDDAELLRTAQKTFPAGYLPKPFGANDLRVALDRAQRRCEV